MMDYISSVTNNDRTATATMFEHYPDLLTPEDLQKALGIGRSTVYRLLNGGQLKHMRIGKTIKIPKRFLIDFVMESCYNDSVAEDSPQS